jgi:hypothetical protein
MRDDNSRGTEAAIQRHPGESTTAREHYDYL